MCRPTVELPEFVIVMEVMRRAMLDKSVVSTIRSAFSDNLAVPVEPVFHGSVRASSRSNTSRQSSHSLDDNGRRDRSDPGPVESSLQGFNLIRRKSQKIDQSKDDVHPDDFGRKSFDRSRHPLTSVMSCDDDSESFADVGVRRDETQSYKVGPRIDGSGYLSI